MSASMEVSKALSDRSTVRRATYRRARSLLGKQPRPPAVQIAAQQRWRSIPQAISDVFQAGRAIEAMQEQFTETTQTAPGNPDCGWSSFLQSCPDAESDSEQENISAAPSVFIMLEVLGARLQEQQGQCKTMLAFANDLEQTLRRLWELLPLTLTGFQDLGGVLSKTVLQARRSIEQLINQIDTIRAGNATVARGVTANIKTVVRVLGTFKETLSPRPFLLVRPEAFEQFLKTLAGIDRSPVEEVSDAVLPGHCNAQEDLDVPGPSPILESQSSSSFANKVDGSLSKHEVDKFTVIADVVQSQDLSIEHISFETSIHQSCFDSSFRQVSSPRTPCSPESQCKDKDNTDRTPGCEDPEDDDINVVQTSASIGTEGDIAEAEDGHAGKQGQDQAEHRWDAQSHLDDVDPLSPAQDMFEQCGVHRHVWQQQALTLDFKVETHEQKLKQDQGERKHDAECYEEEKGKDEEKEEWHDGGKIGLMDSEEVNVHDEDPTRRDAMDAESRRTSKSGADAAKAPYAQSVHRCHIAHPVLLGSPPVSISGKWRVSCLTPEHQRALPETLFKPTQESRHQLDTDQCTEPLWVRWQHKRPSLPPLDMEFLSAELPATRSGQNRSRLATLNFQGVEATNSRLVCTALSARARLGSEMQPSRQSRYAVRLGGLRDSLVPQTARQ